MKLNLAIVLLLFSTVIYANNTFYNEVKNGSISGTIIEASSKNPIPYATIIIKDKSGKTISGSISDDNGFFELKKYLKGYMISKHNLLVTIL